MVAVEDSVDSDLFIDHSNNDGNNNRNGRNNDNVGIIQNGGVNLLGNFNKRFSHLSGWSLSKKSEQVPPPSSQPPLFR